MNNRHGLPWTDEEIELLRSDMDSKELAEKLGRSYYAVTTKRAVICGRKKHRTFKMPDYTAYNVRDESPFRAELIYPSFYLNVPVGRRVYIRRDDLTENSVVKDPFIDAVITKKYPYYCKVVELKTNRTRCIQWSDIARFNMDVFDLYGGKYGK